MLESKTHRLTAMGVPAMPKWMLYLNIGINVLCLGVLIAAAYNLSNHADNIYTNIGPASFLVFDVVFTWIILGVMIGFEFFYQKWYYRLAFIVFLCLAIIFWLSSWAWAAFMANHVGGLSRFYWSNGNEDYQAAMTACAVLGAFTWIALIVYTVFFTLFCLRDESDPTVPGSSGPTTGPTHGGEAEMATRKPEEMADSNVNHVPSPQQDQTYPVEAQAQGAYPTQEQQTYPAQQPYPAQEPYAAPQQPRYS